MSAYNYFGATKDNVIALYPGTVEADYGETSPSAIEAQLARIAREVSGALAVDVYRCLADVVELEEVVKYASAGQTAVQLGLFPIVSGSLHLWRFGQYDDLGVEPVFGVRELTATVVIATGVVTLDANQIVRGDKVFATYELDPENASFSWPSVADVVEIGAAAALGAQLYTQGTQEWGLVTDMRDRYRGTGAAEGGMLASERKGTWIPDELRTLRWWRDIERSVDNSIGSVRKYRT